jgi:Flp pilus assembly protein TadG
MRTRLFRRRTAKSGQSLVEFTLCLPVLLLILLGTIDVSRLFFDYIQMRQAVVEGTTYGQRHPFDTANIIATTRGHGIPGATALSTSADAACAVPGQTGNVQVTATETFTPLYSSTLNALFPQVGGWSFNLSATSTMRCFT